MDIPDNIVEFFSRHGYLNLGSVVDKTLCEDLLFKLRSRQPISAEIFLTEQAYIENPVHKGVNPVPGRNMLEFYPEELSQIESSPTVEAVLGRVLGDSYEIMNKKVICGVPEEWIPEWVLDRIRDNPVNNLGAYVRPEYRNMTYFYGIDFHQDIIDWPGRDLDFITLYVYLHDVGKSDAPLQLLTDSHLMGVDQFPHNLVQMDESNNIWRYVNTNTGQAINCHFLSITGETGNVGLWHSCTLHGTQPNQSDTARLSLRYLIARKPGSRGAIIDEMNSKMLSKAFSRDMRMDLDDQGKPTMKKNYLYREYDKKG